MIKVRINGMGCDFVKALDLTGLEDLQGLGC